MILYKLLESIKIVYWNLACLRRKNNVNTQYAIEYDNFIYVEVAQLNGASYYDNDMFDSIFNVHFASRFWLTHTNIIKPPNVKRQFYRRCRQCPRV